MALILAIGTATKLCSVVLARDGVVLSLCEVEDDRNAHAEKVNVFIAEVLAEGGHTLNELDAVAVSTGPGSYTGLRIGLSAAKGLCYSLDKPIIGLSTLGTLVHLATQRLGSRSGTLWPMIDARRMEVFTQPHASNGSPLAGPAPLILDEAWARSSEPCVVFGDGADKAKALWEGRGGITYLSGIRPSAAAMIPRAEERYSAQQFDDVAYLVPDYGKAANVTRPAADRP